MANNNPPIIPVLFYQDVTQALDWLEEKFGFKRDIIFEDNEGYRWIFGQKMRDVSNEEMAEATGLTVKCFKVV